MLGPFENMLPLSTVSDSDCVVSSLDIIIIRIIIIITITPVPP